MTQPCERSGEGGRMQKAEARNAFFHRVEARTQSRTHTHTHTKKRQETYTCAPCAPPFCSTAPGSRQTCRLRHRCGKETETFSVDYSRPPHHETQSHEYTGTDTSPWEHSTQHVHRQYTETKKLSTHRQRAVRAHAIWSTRRNRASGRGASEVGWNDQTNWRGLH